MESIYHSINEFLAIYQKYFLLIIEIMGLLDWWKIGVRNAKEKKHNEQISKARSKMVLYFY